MCIMSEWLANFDDFCFKVQCLEHRYSSKQLVFSTRQKKKQNPRGVVAFLGPGFPRSKTIVLSTLKEILSFIKGENVSTIQVGGFFFFRQKNVGKKRCSQTKNKQKQKKNGNEGGKEETFAARILQNNFSGKQKITGGELCQRGPWNSSKVDAGRPWPHIPSWKFRVAQKPGNRWEK